MKNILNNFHQNSIKFLLIHSIIQFKSTIQENFSYVKKTGHKYMNVRIDEHSIKDLALNNTVGVKPSQKRISYRGYHSILIFCIYVRNPIPSISISLNLPSLCVFSGLPLFLFPGSSILSTFTQTLPTAFTFNMTKPTNTCTLLLFVSKVMK